MAMTYFCLRTAIIVALGSQVNIENPLIHCVLTHNKPNDNIAMIEILLNIGIWSLHVIIMGCMKSMISVARLNTN
jgi:hypothetical protein